jgi:hypothetical protein
LTQTLANSYRKASAQTTVTSSRSASGLRIVWSIRRAMVLSKFMRGVETTTVTHALREGSRARSRPCRPCGVGLAAAFGWLSGGFRWVDARLALAFGGFPVAFAWMKFECFVRVRWLSRSRRFFGQNSGADFGLARSARAELPAVTSCGAEVWCARVRAGCSAGTGRNGCGGKIRG